MAIMPLSHNYRIFTSSQEKQRSAKVKDDSDDVIQGQGIIDNSSEYASMSMLAASHIKKNSLKNNNEEDWMQFSERILSENADDIILNIENIIHHQLMTGKTLRNFLLRFFPDHSDLLMAIAGLINRKKLKQEQLDQLKELEDLLIKEDCDRKTQAGINIALTAKMFSQKLQQSASHLRTLYREFISYDGPIIYLYEQWVEDMDLIVRENMMCYLNRALACDLQALPLGHSYLSIFDHYFNCVGKLRELYSLDQTFVHYIGSSYIFNKIAINSDFERQFSQLFIKGIRGKNDFNDNLLLLISINLKVTSYDQRAYLLQLLIFAYNSIPKSIYQSDEIKDKLIYSLKELMNEFIIK